MNKPKNKKRKQKAVPPQRTYPQTIEAMPDIENGESAALIVVESENLVDMKLTLNLVKEEESPFLEIVKIKIDRLPWYEDEKKDAIQLEIQSTLKTWLRAGTIDFQAFFVNLENKISQTFNDSTECTIRFKLNVMINDLSDIAAKIFTNVPAGRIMPFGSNPYKNSKEINSSCVKVIDFSEKDNCLAVEFSLTKACIIEEVGLLGGDQKQYEQRKAFPVDTEDVLPPNRTLLVDFPALTPDKLELFQQSSNLEFRLEIRLTGRKDYISIPLPKLPFTESAARKIAHKVILFMDMGSTNTKYVVYDQTKKSIERGDKRGPIPTHDICQEFALDYDKQKLAGQEADIFAAWLTNAVKRIDAKFLENNQAITKIFWAFPRFHGSLTDHFYDSVSLQVTNRIKCNIPEGLVLVPEDVALRGMFERVLTQLSILGEREQKSTGNKNQELRRKRQREIENYNKHWWITRVLFYDDPNKKPIEYLTLDEYYKQCLALGCQNGLKNVVLLDAGGFTLDVYAKINGEPVLARSFRAGGNLLTGKLLEAMRRTKNYESSCEQDAEKEKRKISNGENSKFSDIFPALTQECYGDAIDEIVNALSCATKDNRGLVLVCSGLAFNNPYLLELIQEKMKKAKLLIPSAQQIQNTRTMFNFINGNRDKIDPADYILFSRFLSIAIRTNNQRPDSTFDISGGMFMKEDVPNA